MQKEMINVLESAGLTGSYPEDWEGFVGQEKAVKQLRTAAESAKLRGEPLSHVLLASGVPGIGKTSLALLTAAELGTGIQMVSGQVTATKARITLSRMNDGDVLLIDEIHQLVAGGKRHAEWLLHLLTDNVILGPRGAEVQPKVTVIGTTTDVGRLPDTIVSRFPIRPVLEPYSEEEGICIAIKLAGRILLSPMPWPTMSTFRDVARAANNNPRTMRAILENCRDIVMVDEAAIYAHETKRYDLSEPLDWLGLSPDGLTHTARRYLVTLLEMGGEAGERSMADRLQEPSGLTEAERLLQDKGLIAKTRNGRVLTKQGIKRARELEEA